MGHDGSSWVLYTLVTRKVVGSCVLLKQVRCVLSGGDWINSMFVPHWWVRRSSNVRDHPLLPNDLGLSILGHHVMIQQVIGPVIGTNLEVWIRWILRGTSTACFHSSTLFLIVKRKIDVILWSVFESCTYKVVLDKKRLYQNVQLLIYLLSDPFPGNDEEEEESEKWHWFLLQIRTFRWTHWNHGWLPFKSFPVFAFNRVISAV